MPKNVMKMFKPSPTLGRNDFDLSHRSIHTANYGELIPSLCVETVPGDKIKVRVSDLVRAQPMVTSPFVRAKQHVDVWFVPYNLMWSRFNEFIADKDEPFSSAMKDRLFVPHCSMSQLQTALLAYSSAGTKTNIHGVMDVKQVCRNLDLLGYPGSLLYAKAQNTGSDAAFPDLKFNLWRLAAYNLIWYREYRQQYFDTGVYNLPATIQAMSNGAAFLFNFDWLQCNTEANADLAANDATVFAAMCQTRYRCWKKDIFTGLMPSTQFGNVSVVDTIGQVFNNGNIGSSIAYLGQPSGGGLNSPLVFRDTSGTIIANADKQQVKASADILALRKSEAIQRWRENALRAGNQIEDNFEAHYGVKPKTHLNVHPQFVASFDAPLNIGDINAQAQTGTGANQALGDVAGKGIMSFDGSSEFEFETNDFGVLMGIYSILPEAEYNATNLDRMNSLLERQDYFYPEYENLGLEGVARSVITCNNTNTNWVQGYAPRYFGYKQKHDRICGDFMQFKNGTSVGAPYFNGQFRQWCSPKIDVDSVPSSLPISCLYVNPDFYNQNFAVNWEVSDQFLVDFYAQVEAIRHMTVSGMPGY